MDERIFAAFDFGAKKIPWWKKFWLKLWRKNFQDENGMTFYTVDADQKIYIWDFKEKETQ